MKLFTCLQVLLLLKWGQGQLYSGMLINISLSQSTILAGKYQRKKITENAQVNATWLLLSVRGSLGTWSKRINFHILILLFFWFSTVSKAVMLPWLSFYFHLHGISFFIPSPSFCVCLYIWSESLVDSIYMGLVFVSIQPLCGFWLEHLVHLHYCKVIIDR